MTHVKGRSIYLSGPMTGIEGWNRQAFDDAYTEIKQMHLRICYNPATRIDEYAKFTHQQAILYSINELTSVEDFEPFYDLLVLLPGWKQSEGARIEREVAELCGIEVCELSEVEE